MAKTPLDTFTKEEGQDIFAGLEIRRGALIKNIMPSGIPSASAGLTWIFDAEYPGRTFQKH